MCAPPVLDVFTTPLEKQTGLRARRGATTKSRALTSDEISNEIRKGDTKRKLAQTEKEHRKRIRLLKKTQKPPRQTTRRTRKAKPAGATATSVETAAHSATDRHDYFASTQGLLVNCRSYASMKLTIPDTFLYPFEPTPSSGERRSPHGDARENCESCCCTMTGIWTRVFYARELIRVDTTLPAAYAQYSPGYAPGSKLASVVNRPIRSIYPGIGPPKAELCRMLLPRQQPGVADYHGYVMKAAILLMGRRGFDLPFFSGSLSCSLS